MKHRLRHVSDPALHLNAETFTRTGSPTCADGLTSRPSPIDHVVLKSKKVETAVVQPENVEKEPVEWTNLMGGKIQGNQAVAVFDLNLVRELPPGDIDIVLVTQAGERRCKIGAKDRTKLVK